MQDFSLLDKVKILMDIIASSPLFLLCSISVIIFLVVLLLFSIFDKKVNKWVYITIWGSLFLLIIIFYKDIALNIVDNFFDNIFMAIYFPNLSIYLIVTMKQILPYLFQVKQANMN